MKNNKIMQKPSFWKLLAKNTCILVLTAVLICGVGTWIVNVVYGLVSEEAAYGKFITAKEKLLSSYDDSVAAYSEVRQKLNPDRAKEDDWIVKQHISYRRLQLDGIAAIVFDENKRDVYETIGKDYVFLNIRAKEKKDGSISAWYETEMNGAWKELWDKYDALAEKESVEIALHDVYLKGRAFCPGTICIVTVGSGKTVLWETDMTPENKEEYTHVEPEASGWSCYVSGFFGTDSKRAVKNAEEGVEQLISNGWENYGNYDVLTFDYVQAENVILTDGTEVLYAYAAHYSIFPPYQRILLPLYFCIAVLVLLLSVCLTVSKYHKRKALYEMDRYRRNLTDTMAHDLKTPLMAISGYAENISEEIHPEKNREYMDAIRANTSYMNQMISDILELSKAESAGGKPAKEEVDLAVLTQEILQKYQVLADGKKLAVEMSGGCILRANKTYMQQALENLIGNALKYAEESSTIKVEMSRKSYQITNAFSGTPEVPAEALTQAFVKGAGSRTRTDGSDGTGVGLSITKVILEQQGYRLRLRAEDGSFSAKIGL